MTAEGPETATTPAIPAQRPPSDPAPPQAAPAPAIPVPPPVAAPPSPPVPLAPVSPAPSAPSVPGLRRRRTGMVLLAVGCVVALLLAVGYVVFRPQRGATAAVAAPSAPPAPVAPSPVTPYDKAVQALSRQSAALLRGDENGWLATVDTSLRTRYRNMFRALRGLGVTRFDYQPGLGKPVRGDTNAVSFRADVSYCLGAQMCPDLPGSDWQKPPHVTQQLTMTVKSGRYVITKTVVTSDRDERLPAPWENGEMVFAQGRRVTLAAPKAQAKNLARVLAVAERAAAVDDRYAALIGTTPNRYRIYLAGEKEWKTWYGGDDNAWAIGLAVPLNMHGIDVLLRMKEMGDPLVLRITLQHELGHVVTLTGAYRADAAEDTWLSEGIAEYIGWQPKPASSSLRKPSVRWALRRSDPPKSMVPSPPGANASDRAGDAFYGLSHFAADCMATKYGEKKLFTFVRLVLAQDNEYDQAARDAYGVPFKTVDQYCLRWIRQQVG